MVWTLIWGLVTGVGAIGTWASLSSSRFEWGRLSPVPGVWIDARDRSIGGKGNMVVSLESSVTLFDRVGRELDQGALLRLLSYFPTQILRSKLRNTMIASLSHE